ncbi:manganese-transporting P-type ATPase [Nematocida sp. AWRm80]|nr:manganese-transporting P-type ATPase [Nematocida sp. AWRm80]
MKFELFKRRPVYTYSYCIPVALYPVVYYIGNMYKYGEEGSAAVIGLFVLGVIQSFLFLSSFWSTEMYRISKLQRAKGVEDTELVRIEKEMGVGRGIKVGFATLQTKIVVSENDKIKVNWFEYDNDIFYIDKAKITKLEVQLEHPLKEYSDSKVDMQTMLRNKQERLIFPKNEFKIIPATFISMFAEHAVSPFFVFQIFCALLWMLDEYWKYSLFTFFTIIVFEGSMVFQRLVNIRQLRTLNLAPQKILRLSDVKKEEVLSTTLRPGDKVFLGSKMQVPADLLVIRGNAIVNESMLSGESTPVSKESIPRNSDALLSMDRHKKHILYGGTKIIKIEGKGVECIVLRTGFMTEQGELIKSMIASEDKVSENNKEAYLFIGVMLLFAIASCAYIIKESKGMGKTAYKLALECVMVLTNIVPPELPMELTIAVNSSLQELVSLGVYCLEPFRIPFAGRISVCCFDKTGTLTDLNLQLESIKTQSEIDARIVIGTAHGAILLEDKIEGDPLDLCGMEYVSATLQSDKEILLDNKKYEVLERYSFDSELKRITVLIKQDNEHLVVMKGAPETISQFLKHTPEEYNLFEKYAEQGYRVIALAIKRISAPKRVTTSRSALESQMEFAGFALYNSKLKEEAKETIKHLITSGHKVIMITGDNERTAVSVAKQVGMYNQKWLSGTQQIDEFLKNTATNQPAKDWPCIFARANPDLKERILLALNAQGEYTLMCGDGTNDVGALKTAHVGIALLEGTKNKAKSISFPGNIGQSVFILDEEVKLKLGDASVAAPFTSRTGSLQSVIDVISRGRSALVSTVQMYKVLALNSLLSAYTLSVFDTMGVKYGDFQMTAAGILSALAFTFFSKSKPLKQISREKPVAKIFTKYIITSVALQALTHISAFYFTYLEVIKHGKIVYQEKFEPSLANTSMFLLSSALQVTTLIVNYVGRPFRENITENKKLLYSLLGLISLVILSILEVSDDLNQQMQLIKIPLDLKIRLLFVMAADFIFCLGIERISFNLFMAPQTKQKTE